VSAATRRARAAAVRGRRAGLASRALADGVDFVVIGVLLFGILVGFAAIRYLIDGEFEMPRVGAVFSASAFPIVAVLYLTVLWSTTGRSIGKHLFGLRVVRDDGTPLGVLRAAARSLLCVVIGVFSLLWAAVSRRNAGVHDLVVRTSVVHDWAPAHDLPPVNDVPPVNDIPPVSDAVPQGEPV
jgi:uncharacterized RDD family membrane protein YckC